MRHAVVVGVLAGLVVGCSSANSGSSDGDGGSASDGGSSVDGAAQGDAASGSGCRVVAKGSAGVAIRGRILAPSGPMDGELLVDAAGKIACVDAACDKTAGYAQATHLDCGSGVVSPALINAHDHTNFDATPPQALGKTRYQHRHEWRTGADGATALPKVPSTSDPKQIAAAELRFVMSGTTSVVGSGGTAGLLRNLAGQNGALLEGLSGGQVYFDTFPLGDSNGTILTSGCAYPSIRKSSSAFAGGNYAPHVSEGINVGAENEMLCFDQASVGLLTAKTAIIHAVGMNARDVDVIAKAGAKVIWSPRSNIDLYGNTMPVTEFKAAGVTIALGTDWLPSGSMNMLRELACADSLNAKYFHGAFSDRELWEMATKNAAVASGFDAQVGTLEVGKIADVTVLGAPSQKDYRAVLEAGVEDVALVLRGGKALYGDAALLDALGAGGAGATTCAPIDVCGTPKAICLDVPNMKLADVQQAASSVYPLFFCRAAAVTAEPSCVPYRDTYPSGTSATDHDGDGVADAQDDCPDVFNPPRAMDADKQSDVDGDGVGDACDAKPLDPGAH